MVELFWSFQVYRKKTLTKSHDYSPLFSQEKRRLKIENSRGGESKSVLRFIQILPNLRFITPFSNLEILVTVAQLVVRLSGRHELMGWNPC